MAKRPNLTDITNVLTSASTHNANNDEIETAFDNTLSRDGSTPNQMEADFDMNSNDILNARDVGVSRSLTVQGVDILESLTSPTGPATIFNTTNRFSGDGSTTAFTLTKEPVARANTHVFIQGVYQNKDQYVVSGTTLTFNTAPGVGTNNIEVIIQEATDVGTVQIGDIEGAFFTSRADLVTWWAAYGAGVPSGVIVTDGTVKYVKDGGTSIVDLSGLSAYGDFYPDHLAENTTPGTTDMSSAINTYLAYCSANSVRPAFRDGVLYRANSNLTSLLTFNFVNRTAITDGTNTLYLGPGWYENQNIIYVSTTGATTNDGLNATRPIRFADLQSQFERQVYNNPLARWRVQFAAGTYAAGTSLRFDDFPETAHQIEFFGESIGAKTATVIFSAWTSPVFYKLYGSNVPRLSFKDMTVDGGTGQMFDLRNCGEITSDNVNCTSNPSGAPFLYRSCQMANHINSAIANATGGVVMQNCYTKSFGVQNCDFDGIVGSGLGSAVEFSRGTSGYVQDCTFGTTTANDIHIKASRNSRVRQRGNTYGDFNTTILYGEVAPAIFNFDGSDPNTYSGALNTGDQVWTMRPGCYVDGVYLGHQGDGHRFYPLNSSSTWPYLLTGTTRTQVDAADAELAPFSMPGIWLYSPKAKGVHRMTLDIPVAETVTIEWSGNGSSAANDLFGSLSITTSGAEVFDVSFEFIGPVPGFTVGRYKAVAVGSAGTVATGFGATDSLNTSVFRAASESKISHRLYITRSVGTGNLRILEANSSVSI